jgi:MFS transporter, SP family, general alpha glucoside:H+ symporter
MVATVREVRLIAEKNSEDGVWSVFRGRNLIRFIIAGWPKITQQFVGLSVFNTFATYFSDTWPFNCIIALLDLT